MSPLLPALVLLATADAADERYRTALFFSNNVGAGRPMLAYADTDAVKLAQVLEELGGFVESTRVPQASAGQLRQEMLSLAERVDSASRRGLRTEVVVYYSGHSDEQGLLLGDDKVPYAELKGYLDEIGADVQVAIVDSCASGTLIRTKGSVPHPPFLVDRSSLVSGSAVLTSSSADEASQESDRISGSYFTHALVSGLRGAADASRDQRVSLTEAYHFAYGETLARTERTLAGAQHAAYDLDLAGTGDLVMTDLSVTEATLEVDAPIDGRVFVWTEPGGLVAELAKTQGQSVTLGLAAGTYTVVVDHGGRMEEVSFELAEGESVRLSDLGLRSAELAWNRLRGDAGLPERHEAFSFGIFPAIHGRNDDILVQHMAISLVATASDRVQGMQLALGANLAEADVRGLQLSVGGNLAGGPVSGMQASVGANLARSVTGPGQWAVGANISEGTVRGMQSSVGFNVATGLQGAQATVGFNVAGPMQGAQMSVGANIATHARGLQLSVGPNVAAKMQGLQLAVGPQVAKEIHGAQISLINVGGTVEGAQIGLINVAKEVKGTQVGLVNVSAKMKGAPIGLVSVAGNGYNHAWLMGNDTSQLSLGLTSGGSRFYTTIEGGIRPDGDLWSYGLGLGWHEPLGSRLFLDVDTTALYGHGTAVGPGQNALIIRPRALLGLQLMPRLAIVGGPTLSVLPIGEPDDLTLLPTSSLRSVPFWPGLTLGVRI